MPTSADPQTSDVRGDAGSTPAVTTPNTIPASNIVDGDDAATAPQPKAVEGDGDSQQQHDGFKISKDAFNERITRAKQAADRQAEQRHKKFLVDTFGTDNPEEITKIKSGFAELSKEKEEAERQQMSALERANADLEAAKASAADWETKHNELKRSRLYDKQDSAIRQIASQHVGEDYLDDVVFMFARHLKKNVTAEEAKTMDKKQVAKWFTDLAKKKPAFAREAAAPKKRERRESVTTGPSPNAGRPTPNASNGGAAKTARPGQPNSMTKGEYRKYLRQKGINY